MSGHARARPSAGRSVLSLESKAESGSRGSATPPWAHDLGAAVRGSLAGRHGLPSPVDTLEPAQTPAIGGSGFRACVGVGCSVSSDAYSPRCGGELLAL